MFLSFPVTERSSKTAYGAYKFSMFLLLPIKCMPFFLWVEVISQLLKIFPEKHKELSSTEENLDMIIVHPCNHITGEADTGRFLGFTGQHGFPTWQVSGQWESLSKKQQNKSLASWLRSRGVCSPASWLVLHPCDPHGRRREVNTASCPLNSTHALWPICAYPLTHYK